ncbi:transposase, partial [Streptococcus suis]
RKVDVEPVFGRMKGVFGVRRVHVRGQKVVETEIGFLLMSMNLILNKNQKQTSQVFLNHCLLTIGFKIDQSNSRITS